MDIPPRKRRGQPRWVLVDEEEPQFPHSLEEPQVLLRFEPQFPQGFLVLPMPQPGFFPLMTPKAY